MTYQERKAQVRSYLGKIVNIKIDRPIGYVHKKEKYSLTYPINYGYIPEVLSGDGEELDVYLMGVNEPVVEYTCKIIGIVHRHNDVEDKLIAAPEGKCYNKSEIAAAINFQEQYYTTHIEALYDTNEKFSVIFDMDGTLLDTQQICVTAWEVGGQNQGIFGVGNDMPNVCGMNCAGWTKYLNDKYPQMDTDRFNAEARAYVIDNLVVKFKPGAKELLEFLKSNGIKIGLATGSSAKTIEHHLNEVDAFEYFDATVAGDEVANGKPAPDVFLEAAKRICAKPENCFVFEDSSNGVKSGYNAGMKCIGVPDIADFDTDVKTLLFAQLTRLDEAIEIFKKML